MLMQFIWLPVVVSLRFQDEVLPGLKASTEEASEVSESWCMQFPYCPTGCSLFCVPESTVPGAIPTAATTSGAHSAGRLHGSRKHHKKHHRRRKSTVTDFVNKVESVKKIAASISFKNILPKGKSQTEMKTNKNFQALIIAAICANNGISKADAITRIKNIVIDFKVLGSAFFQQVAAATEGKDATVDYDLLPAVDDKGKRIPFPQVIIDLHSPEKNC